MNLDEKRKLLYAGFYEAINWAENAGYEVIEGPEEQDACWSDVKHITVYSSQGIENRLYSLLHECGHALIRRDWTKFESEYPAHATAELDRRKMKSDKYKVSLVEEEVEAWKRGRRLAKRLGIYVDDYKFNKLKTKCLMSYFNWAVDE